MNQNQIGRIIKAYFQVLAKILTFINLELMASNIRLPLPMHFNGIVKIGEKIETDEMGKSILEFYKTKAWVNRGNLAGIDFAVAVRKFDQPLQLGAYYRLNGPVFVTNDSGRIIFLPEGDDSINVGTNFIRPPALADKITVNSCGVITQRIHHEKENVILQNIVLTALPRYLNPTVTDVTMVVL
ncbi:hypothetical protein DFH28DRAFT_921160 [Melampsora americana]|nr:hypothetical protein DFH28DRAFT_921160 [Melampsora americana]